MQNLVVTNYHILWFINNQYEKYYIALNVFSEEVILWGV